jgi:hypothetical protein
MSTEIARDEPYIYVGYEPVPDGLVWYTPDRLRGKTVEVSYSTGVHNHGANIVADEGDPWRRTVDRSDGTTYYEQCQPADLTGRRVTWRGESLSAPVTRCDDKSVSVRPGWQGGREIGIPRSILTGWDSPDTDNTNS